MKPADLWDRARRMIRRNLAVAVTMTAVWLVVDLVDVKVARLPSFPGELQIVLATTFIVFVLTNRNAWPQLSSLYRWPAVAGVASILTVVWFAISIAIVLSFHLRIGGTL